MQIQQPLPEIYRTLPSDQLERRIGDAKAALGKTLCILGHHYQSDEVIQFADFTGDSLKLSQQAAEQTAKYIVFCGVHFMAESADILSGPDQVVCLPNMLAGCAMADMATAEAVTAALDEVATMTNATIVPVTYVNSTAAIKAITARAGGPCCTSSNVRNVFAWALAGKGKAGPGKRKILAIPDQHLARNTAFALGYGDDDCAVYDPALPDGGLDAAKVQRATFILWKGHCYVHQRFRAEQVRNVRTLDQDVTVIVHPECPREVVALADAAGSTEQIIRAVKDGKPGSKWAIGTEANLVNRLAWQHRDKQIRILSDTPSTCIQMARIDLSHLAWVLESLVQGQIVNHISVDPPTAGDARVALQRMIDIKAVKQVTGKRPGQ